MRFTVFGARGFIGSALAQHLRARGHEVQAPSRDAGEVADTELGHVVYAIGLTGDFRGRPFDTVDAHVGTLARLMRGASYESWLYLSSTRLYGTDAARSPRTEDEPVTVAPGADSLYDLSKLLGEALCLALPRTRVARLSNVYGAGLGTENFLGAIVDEIRRSGEATIREAPGSSKDYVALAAIVPLLEAIALRGRERIYNVASGHPLTHRELADRLGELTGATVRFAPGAPERAFPRIDVTRIEREFSFCAPRAASDLAGLLPAMGLSPGGIRQK
ncbi:MAG: NAD-dependent epimerase/dehydratase family protein [Usitatibacter sp.]